MKTIGRAGSKKVWTPASMACHNRLHNVWDFTFLFSGLVLVCVVAAHPEPLSGVYLSHENCSLFSSVGADGLPLLPTDVADFSMKY